MLESCNERVAELFQAYPYEQKGDSEAKDFVLKSGLEDGLKIAEVPEAWQAPEPKVCQGEPPFDQVDNPGQWNSFCFRPKFSRSKEYLFHTLPSGARPVAMDSSGNRSINGWDFHYSTWKHDSPESFRNGAITENLFPDKRKGCLDKDLFQN